MFNAPVDYPPQISSLPYYTPFLFISPHLSFLPAFNGSSRY